MGPAQAPIRLFEEENNSPNISQADTCPAIVAPTTSGACLLARVVGLRSFGIVQLLALYLNQTSKIPSSNHKSKNRTL